METRSSIDHAWDSENPKINQPTRQKGV